MIPNCAGCKEDFDEACYQVSLGHHVATGKDWPSSENIGRRGHYAVCIIDNNGNIIVR